ncbi:MAG TPA: YetF domain-containing protein [Acidimicrobiales bacterium]
MEIVVRSTVMFFVAWAVSRAVGKRGLSQMTPLDMILLVVIGDLIQQGATQEDMSVTGSALAVSTIAVWVILFTWASFRWRSLRNVIDGVPVLLLRDGELLEEVMRAEHLPLDEVMEQARGQGIDDLSSVRVAVLEPNGSISFIR